MRKVESADNGLLIETHGTVIADRLAKAQKLMAKRKNNDEVQKLTKDRDEAKAQVSTVFTKAFQPWKESFLFK